MLRRFLPLILLTFCLGAFLWADDEPALRTLTTAGVKSDPPSLIEFFRQRTPKPEDKALLEKLITQLGDDSFENRQDASAKLVEAGRRAAPFLRGALSSTDREIVSRAKRCIAKIGERPDTDLVLSVATVLAQRKLEADQRKEAIDVMSAYLPYLEEEHAEEEYFEQVRRIHAALEKSHPAIVAALTSKSERTRGLAARVLGRSAKKAERDLAKGLLVDPSPLVRWRTADAFTLAKDKRGITVLIALIESGPIELAHSAEALLVSIAGEKAPSATLSSEEKIRATCAQAWAKWDTEHGVKLDLSKIDFTKLVLGLRLVVANSGYGGNGAVWEYGADKKTRWEMRDVGGPFDALILTGGNLLIAEYNTKRLTERDRTGKVLWEHKTAHSPLEIQRLRNGNVLYATNHGLYEINKDGKVIFTHPEPSTNLFSAQKLSNGHYLYGLYTGTVHELDAAGKEVNRFDIHKPRGLANILVLPSGGYLIPDADGNRIVEYDRRGKVVKSISVSGPTSVDLLPGGNLLIGSHMLSNVREIDRSGKVLWEHRAEGQVFRVRVR